MAREPLTLSQTKQVIEQISGDLGAILVRLRDGDAPDVREECAKLTVLVVQLLGLVAEARVVADDAAKNARVAGLLCGM